MSFLTRSYPISFPSYVLPSRPFRRKFSSDSAASSSSAGSDLTATVFHSDADGEPSALQPDGDYDYREDSFGSAGSKVPCDLPGTASFIRCSHCAAELCMTSQIVSRGFTGSQGRAYLVAPPDTASDNEDDETHAGPASSLANLYVSRHIVPKNFITGAHTVRNIACRRCGTALGWKYISADDESQRYKVGKFILETRNISTATAWEFGHLGRGAAAGGGKEDADRIRQERTVIGSGRTLDRLMRPAIVEGEEIEFDSEDEDECEDLFLGQWTPEVALSRRRAKLFMATK